MTRKVVTSYGEVREVEDDDRSGRCFELSAEKVRDTPGAVLIHGSIQGFGHPRIEHAWVRLANGTIWEPRFDRMLLPAYWKAEANAESWCSHDRRQVANLVVEHGHLGPWPDCEARRKRHERRRK